MDTRRSILDFLHHFTVAWHKLRMVALERLLLPETVFLLPERHQGREACLQACREFREPLDRLEWVDAPVSLDWWGATAMVILEWRANSPLLSFHGRDTHTLIHDGVRWKLVWLSRQPL